MSITVIENKEQLKEGGISINNLSENDKGEVLRYLRSEKQELQIDSILNPENFFKELNSLSKEEKQKILENLENYFKNKNIVIQNELDLKKIKQEKVSNTLSQNIEAEQLKQLLLKDEENNNTKSKYLQEKRLELNSFYNGGIKIIDKMSFENLKDNIKEFIDINKPESEKNMKSVIDFCERFNLSVEKKTISNLQKINKFIEDLSEKNKEHIYGIIGSDGSLHLVNDIDTGHYIIPKNLMESGDVSSFVKDFGEKKQIMSKKINTLNEFDSNDKIIYQIRDNKPL